MARRSFSFFQSHQFEEPIINLTPLIDVVFVILIMFIVMTPLLELDQVSLASGSTLSLLGQVQQNSPVVIHVYEDNSLAFNDRVVNLKQLSFALKQAKSQHPQACPQVLHDQKAYFGTYQAVKNLVEEAGFSQLNIILKPAA